MRDKLFIAEFLEVLFQFFERVSAWKAIVVAWSENDGEFASAP